MMLKNMGKKYMSLHFESFKQTLPQLMLSSFQTEFFAYDIWDLTAGLGGLMGIFLGWSFLYIIIQLYMVLENTCINFFV